jgi:hypothetical protein
MISKITVFAENKNDVQISNVQMRSNDVRMCKFQMCKCSGYTTRTTLHRVHRVDVQMKKNDVQISNVRICR